MDYYQLLNVPYDATSEDIIIAYRLAVQKHHPDKNPGNLEEANKKIKEINLAFEQLYDPVKRSQYNLKQPVPPKPKPKPKPGPKPTIKPGQVFPHNNGIFDVDPITDLTGNPNRNGLNIGDLWKQSGMEEYDPPVLRRVMPRGKKQSNLIDP